MKKVLFFPQNDSHIPNMQPISEWLLSHGYEVTYLDASKIYHQRLLIDSKYRTIIPSLSLEHSFYQLPNWERLKCVHRFSREVSDSLVSEYDILVIGNDGALQRVLINRFRKQKRKIVLLLDGMISDYSFSFYDIWHCSSALMQDILDLSKIKLMRFFIRQCAKSMFSPYLPGLIGISPVSDIFVIGSHSKEVIQRVNLQAHVYDWGLPRFSQVSNEEGSSLAISPLKICYFPSAYKWHGLFEKDKAQHQDIRLCCDIIQQINQKEHLNLQFLIKMHPRESVEDYYDYMNQYDFVCVESDLSVQDCFASCSLFLSNLSTVIVEGLMVGIPVYSLMLHFDYWKYKNSFLKEDCIQKIYDRQTLYDTLLTKRTIVRNPSLIEASNYFCNRQVSIDILCQEIIK